MMNGARFSTAAVMPATIASPAAMPSVPPWNAKSCTAVTTSWPSSLPTAASTASLRAGLGAMFLQPVGVALDVAEFQRIGGRLRATASVS